MGVLSAEEASMSDSGLPIGAAHQYGGSGLRDGMYILASADPSEALIGELRK